MNKGKMTLREYSVVFTLKGKEEQPEEEIKHGYFVYKLCTAHKRLKFKIAE